MKRNCKRAIERMVRYYSSIPSISTWWTSRPCLLPPPVASAMDSLVSVTLQEKPSISYLGGGGGGGKEKDPPFSFHHRSAAGVIWSCHPPPPPPIWNPGRYWGRRVPISWEFQVEFNRICRLAVAVAAVAAAIHSNWRAVGANLSLDILKI